MGLDNPSTSGRRARHHVASRFYDREAAANVQRLGVKAVAVVLLRLINSRSPEEGQLLVIFLLREKQMKKYPFAFVLLALLTGCTNMPTPSSQITGSYTSGLKYEEFGCSKLAIELDSLARREDQLVVVQEQRIKTSQTQAFWWGYGQGDGIEASELANVRGEKEAVRKAMEHKGCDL
ncbi:MAG: hypothetical protein LRY36_01555 [Alphaproteobacteria bacterium]|nr:hypothetical protein [Alphaproteobacteria bacterium]